MKHRLQDCSVEVPSPHGERVGCWFGCCAEENSSHMLQEHLPIFTIFFLPNVGKYNIYMENLGLSCVEFACVL